TTAPTVLGGLSVSWQTFLKSKPYQITEDFGGRAQFFSISSRLPSEGSLPAQQISKRGSRLFPIVHKKHAQARIRKAGRQRGCVFSLRFIIGVGGQCGKLCAGQFISCSHWQCNSECRATSRA